jgi:hypothetical protein
MEFDFFLDAKSKFFSYNPFEYDTCFYIIFTYDYKNIVLNYSSSFIIQHNKLTNEHENLRI